MRFNEIIPCLKEVQSMSVPLQNFAAIHCFSHEWPRSWVQVVEKCHWNQMESA